LPAVGSFLTSAGPGQRLVVEADGGAWHDNAVAREDDVERQALLETHGDRALRVTSAQAIAKPAQPLARIRAAGAPESQRPDAGGCGYAG